MNDADLAAALRAIHREAAAIAEPPTLRARVLAIPTERPRGAPRRWARSMRRWQTRQSATRLIAAVAVVALGSGAIFLAASQGPSPMPTIAPSPTVWTLPPGFVSEEVEPGVLRVLSDGVRELAFDADLLTDVGLRVEVAGIATGLDGSVWLFLETGPLRLGDARIHAMPPTIHLTENQHKAGGDLGIGTDGTLWVAGDDRGDLVAIQGDAWTRYRGPDGQTVHEVEVLRDGTTWATFSVDGRPVVGVLDGDTWRIAAKFPRSNSGDDLLVSDNGDIWLGGRDANQPDAGPVVPDAERAAVPELAGTSELAGVSPDGTLWVRTGEDLDSLARVDASGVLTRYDADDGVLRMCCVGQGREGRFVVAPDGSLWITAGGGPCNSSLHHFDGSTWVRYDLCAWNIDVAPDGALWFWGFAGLSPPPRSEAARDGLGGTYVIPPASADG